MTRNEKTNGLFSFEELEVLKKLKAAVREKIIRARNDRVNEQIRHHRHFHLTDFASAPTTHKGDPNWETVSHDAITSFAHKTFQDPREHLMVDSQD